MKKLFLCFNPAVWVMLALLGSGIWPRAIQAHPAAMITVNTTVDELNNDGDCSLREAIQAANTNAAVDACPAGSGSDTITFDPATNGNPIILTGASNENGNLSGDLDILNGGHLTIQGNGMAHTIISGNGIDRIFHVCPGDTCDSEVAINGLAVRNGGVSFSGGGGILNNGTLGLQNCLVGGMGHGNDATFGGGIANLDAGTLILDGSTVSANRAQNAGGIYNRGTLVLQNGSLVGGAGVANQATEGNGGGILNEAGSTVLVDSRVISNAATGNGGGIWSQTTLMVQNGSQISSNTARYGAGIYNDAGALTLLGSKVSANIASWGGGLYNINDGTLSVTDSRINTNQATSDGGGVYNFAGITTIVSSTISTNTSGDTAGGIYNYQGTTTVDASVVRDNFALDYAGGIINDDVLIIQNGSSISSNTANNFDGGGIFNYTYLTVDASQIISNTAGDEGGGIYDLGLSVIQNGSLIRENTAVEGGGIHSRGVLTITHSLLEHNAVTESGGGIFATGGATVVLLDSTIRANTAALDGGGIYSSGHLHMGNLSTVKENYADQGGGIYSTNRMVIADSRILDNVAATNGGGIYSDRDDAEAANVTGSCIVGNSDMAFFNNQPAQQIAPENWWGTPTGPNTAGADTVSGNWDTRFFLTTPPVFCLEIIYLPLVVK